MSEKLNPEDLQVHPNGDVVDKISKDILFYRNVSRWRDRFCGNCGWFEETDISNLPDAERDVHPEADGKGEVHRCALVEGGISKGGFCLAWGTAAFCENLNKSIHKKASEIFNKLKDNKK